jgi:small conductance mechanosensitive channel
VVMNKTIASYTNFPNLRIDIRVTVAVTENIDRVRSILLNLIQQDPDYLMEPAPRMVVVALNDYNIAVELQAWIKEERKHIEKRFALREAIFKALVAAQVEMPLETIQLAPHRVNVHHSE